MRALLLAVAAVLLAPPGAFAQKVSYNGLMGERALLVIDGQPHVLAVGTSARGVRLMGLSATQAQVEVQGERRTLAIGSGGIAGAATSPGNGNEIVLAAGPGGHFTSPGMINGRPVQFMVDTGASVVALSEELAQRIGLNYRQGERVQARTANGIVPGHVVVLSSVRIGDVQAVNVQALVLPASTEHVLLGNSFLSRFQMRRENDVMRLTRRY
jgi:aspartyl protease family protein